MDIEQSLALAASHLDSGRLDDAELLCRQVLESERDPYALHFLGLIHQRCNRHGLALPLLREAAAMDSESGEHWHALGHTLNALEQWDAAVEALRRAAELQPDVADVQGALGVALSRSGNRAEAQAAFAAQARLAPEQVQAHHNLGAVLDQQGKLGEALAAFSRALALKPDFAEAHCSRGVVFNKQGKLPDAIDAFSTAIRLKPGFADAHCHLGSALHEQRNFDQAVAAFSTAIRLKPDDADAYCGLGMALHDQRKLDEAVAAFSTAIRLKPDLAVAHNNLGVALKDQGKLDEALASFDREIELRPDDAAMHSNRIYTLHYHPAYDPAAILREQQCWDQRHAQPLKAQMRPHPNDASPGRRLKIGYVSPDFTLAPVGRFLSPLLENHDHSAFEIFCYSDVRRADALTSSLRAAADVWRDTVGLGDQDLANLIRQDHIDVLVDLTMHMAYNRLLVFARKPAPVQVTYLAVASGTGLEAMDYRLTDPYLDPPGTRDEFYSEQSIRLAETYFCYQPGIQTPPVLPPPALKAGFVTFGCLSNFCKVTQPTLETWCKLLAAAPHSRLLLHSYEGSHRTRVTNLLERHGIDPARLTFSGFVPGQQYFQLYHGIDIGLDPFPYGGGTTFCDAMWMGVPTVSLVGQTGVSRMGLSLLSNVGLAELAANCPEQYVRIAADLAGDLERLSKLRSGLRGRMLASPLMDGPRFAKNIEAAYRQMWNQWCAHGSHADGKS